MQNQNMVKTIEIRNDMGQVVGTKEVVLYQGLLNKAHEEGLKRISTQLTQIPGEENHLTAIVTAEVEVDNGIFCGIGDANPSNVAPMIVPHLIRAAETRAKARALRDAVNIGVVALEELRGEVLEHELHEERAGGKRDSNRSETREAGLDNSRMTENQRRYLFRLLGERGIRGDKAHSYLKEALEVESLKTVTKAAASNLINQMVEGKGATR